LKPERGAKTHAHAKTKFCAPPSELIEEPRHDWICSHTSLAVPSDLQEREFQLLDSGRCAFLGPGQDGKVSWQLALVAKRFALTEGESPQLSLQAGSLNSQAAYLLLLLN